MMQVIIKNKMSQFSPERATRAPGWIFEPELRR